MQGGNYGGTGRDRAGTGNELVRSMGRGEVARSMPEGFREADRADRDRDRDRESVVTTTHLLR